MISDLKADSITWKEEERQGRRKQGKAAHLKFMLHVSQSAAYTSTQTHTNRRKQGASRPLPIPTTSKAATAQGRQPAVGRQPNRAPTQPPMATSPPATAPDFVSRVEVERLIARRLQDAGSGVTRSQLDRLVDEALRKHQQQTSGQAPPMTQAPNTTQAPPPPYTPDPGQPDTKGGYGAKYGGAQWNRHAAPG